MSEKKYIDADWLSHWIDKKLNAYRIINDCRDGKAIYDFIKNVLVPIVKTAPAADVAEIVRCKDCKYFCEKEGKCYGQDIRAEEGHDCYKNDDDFCSCGERK